MSDTSEENECIAGDMDPCHCPVCEAELERQKAHFGALYAGEKAAGLHNRECCHRCGRILISYSGECPVCDR